MNKFLVIVGLLLILLGLVYANNFSLDYKPCSFADEISLTSYVVNASEPVSKKGYFYNGDEARCLTPLPMGLFFVNEPLKEVCEFIPIPIILNQNQLFFINNKHNSSGIVIDTDISQKPLFGKGDC